MGFLSSRDFRGENLNKHLSELLPPSRQRAKKNPARLSSAPDRTQIYANPQSGRRLRRAVARVALEEQRLARHRRHHGGLERFGDQERRLGALAGQEALRIGGDEHHRHLEGPEQLVDRIEAGRAVGELDVGEDQAGLLVLGERHGVRMGAGHADDVVAEIAHQAFEVHRDEGLVLDDQHVGGDLGGHLAAGRIGEPPRLARHRCRECRRPPPPGSLPATAAGRPGAAAA